MPITPRNRIAALRLALGLALLITTWLSLSPQPVALPDVQFADKWVHLVTYVVLAFLLDASWPESGFDPRKWLPLLAYGVLIEVLQSQIPNRFFSLSDLLANAGGIVIYGLVVLRLIGQPNDR